jgi:hypothetical protein
MGRGEPPDCTFSGGTFPARFPLSYVRSGPEPRNPSVSAGPVAGKAYPGERSLKPFSLLCLTLLLSTPLPPALRAQEEPPAGLAKVELARSRSCVGSLARLAALNATLEPIARRIDRLNVLGRAVSLEKAEDAEPLDPSDPVEEAVARWFAADSALALRYLAAPDSTLLQERSAARTAILDRIGQSIQELAVEGQAKAREGAPVQAEAQPCEGAILVRSAVLEACATTESPVCDAAAAPEPAGSGRFVEAPEDLWDVEQYTPWNQPAALQPSPDGGLMGARTSARARRGNVVFSLSLAPLLRRRADLSEEEIGEFEANLDSLGFKFDHPLFVMAPGFELQAQLPAPLGGETHYVVHFGDLTGDDVIWSMEAGTPGLVQASFPAREQDLARLQAGEPVSLTALRVPEGEGAEAQATAVFTLTLLQVGQANNVAALLQHMASGALSRDLAALVPPGAGG